MRTLAAAPLIACLLLVQGATSPEQRLAAARQASLKSAERVAQLEQQTSQAVTRAEALAARNALLKAQLRHAETTVEKISASTAILDQQLARQQTKLGNEQGRVVALLAALDTLSRRPAIVALTQPGSLKEAARVAQLLESILPLLRDRTTLLRNELMAFRQMKQRSLTARATLEAAQQNVNKMRIRLAEAEGSSRAKAEGLATDALVESDRAFALSVQARDLEDIINDNSSKRQLGIRLAALPGPVVRPSRLPAHALPAHPLRPDNPTHAGGLSRNNAAITPLPKGLSFRLPISGQLVEGYGAISSAGIRARGIALKPVADSAVVAPSSGRIAFAGPFRDFGNIIIVEHANGLTSLVTGLSVLQTSVGQSVKQGATIGLVKSDVAKLTIEVRYQGHLIDPLRLVEQD